MRIWDFRPTGDVLTGVAVGVGVLAVPLVAPLAWSAVRPVLKAMLKSGFLLYETGRGVFGEAIPLAESEEAKERMPVKSGQTEVKATHEKERVSAPTRVAKQDKQKTLSQKSTRQTKTAKKKPEMQK